MVTHRTRQCFIISRLRSLGHTSLPTSGPGVGLVCEWPLVTSYGSCYSCYHSAKGKKDGQLLRSWRKLSGSATSWGVKAEGHEEKEGRERTGEGRICQQESRCYREKATTSPLFLTDGGHTHRDCNALKTGRSNTFDSTKWPQPAQVFGSEKSHLKSRCYLKIAKQTTLCTASPSVCVSFSLRSQLMF